MNKKLNILFLEDNIDDVNLIVRKLKKDNIDFDWKRVVTEKEYKKSLLENPDIILADFKLSSFDGISAVQIQQKMCPEIPLIIVSGVINNEDAIECMRLGAKDYIFKDNLVRFIPAFKRTIKGSQLERTLKEKDEKQLIKIQNKTRELELIIDNMSCGFALHEMIFDENNKPIDYKFLSINKSFKLLTGLGQDIVGKYNSEVFYDDVEKDDWISFFGDIFTKNKTLHFEKYSEYLEKWYLIDAYRQNSNKFVTISEDITAIKLKEQQNLDIMNSTLCASYLIDNEGKIISVNDKGCEIFGRTREELIGEKIKTIMTIKTSEYKRKKILEVMFTGSPVYFMDDFEGEYYENFIFPINDKDNNIEYVAIHFKNITEQELIKIELEKEKIKAEESDLLKSIFLANMSHEIRTPMSSIIGFSDILLDPNYNDMHKEKFLRTINANAKHLDELLNNVLDYAKIETGEIDLLYEKFSINELFDELDDIFSDINDKKNLNLVKLVFEKRKSKYIIVSDFLKLKQVLYNIISNAIKFTEIGHIRIGTKIRKNIMTFFIEDTGIGIPKSKIGIIFDKFVQVDDSSKKRYHGAGLGLSISKSIVEILGGDIWVKSNETKGTTFYFTLLLESDDNVKTKVTTINNDFPNLNVLIIEEIPKNYSLLSIVLKSMNINLKWSNNIKETINIFKDNSNAIDVIFINVFLSNNNLLNFIKNLKQIDKTITIISISVMQIENENIDFHIVKPITKEKISKILNKIYVN